MHMYTHAYYTNHELESEIYIVSKNGQTIFMLHVSCMYILLFLGTCNLAYAENY